jgi:riboflavin transporter FmnP
LIALFVLLMNTKEISLTITFTALTIALDPIRIPSVILPAVYFRFCEIPIVVAFLLLGSAIAISIAALNTIVEIILFPGPAVFVGRPLVFMLTICMLFGIYLGGKLLKRKALQNPNHRVKPVFYFTVLGALFRAAVAPMLNYPMWRFVIPALAGLPLSFEQVMALMPAFVLYAVVFCLYTIPIGYFVARVVGRSLKLGNLP